MARLSRLSIPGETHHVLLRGHGGVPVFADDEDRRRFLQALRDAAARHRTALHAYALGAAGAQFLCTPTDATSVGRLVQWLGRHYVSAYNRRHGRAGTLWDGRYRCALVEAGDWRLAALRLVDASDGWTSAGHRLGLARDPALADPPEVWALGNTPFEREHAWRALLDEPLPPGVAEALRDAVAGGWAAGSPRFVAAVGEACSRPAAKRPRGRPRRT